MDLSFFVRGLLIGFSIAATVGPMCILCIQRTLHKGQLYGLVSGLGIATADAVYGSIAAFGLTLITNFLVNQQGWVRLIGGLFLIYLGLKTVIAKPAERAATAKANGYFGAYASTFLLTLTNPMTILSFAAVFAGLGLGGGATNYAGAALLVLGVFLGSALWWLFLSWGVGLFREKLNDEHFRWVNRISGTIIAGFGLLALVSSRQ